MEQKERARKKDKKAGKVWCIARTCVNLFSYRLLREALRFVWFLCFFGGNSAKERKKGREKTPKEQQQQQQQQEAVIGRTGGKFAENRSKGCCEQKQHENWGRKGGSACARRLGSQWACNLACWESSHFRHKRGCGCRRWASGWPLVESWSCAMPLPHRREIGVRF